MVQSTDFSRAVFFATNFNEPAKVGTLNHRHHRLAFAEVIFTGSTTLLRVQHSA